MPTKTGRIVSFGRRGSKFTEAQLDSGDRVELSPAMMAEVLSHHPPDSLVFVERRGRIFHYVHWVGTFEQAAQAMHDGILRIDEVPWTVQLIGDETPRLRAKTAANQKGRYEWAVLQIRGLLSADSTTPVLSFAKLMVAVLHLDDSALESVRQAWEERDSWEWLQAYGDLSAEAIQVGFAVRWVRWPNPIEEAANVEFRHNMDPAAAAIESAAAALAEPALSPEQVATMYGPLQLVIPRGRLIIGIT